LDHNKGLTDYQFEQLHFKNSLGTDVTIDLVKNHIWAGGGETSTKGITFNPNIPTEENFTMPHKFGVNGKVVATKPLNYQGNLIEDFWLEFKDGKVINYDAKKQVETLKSLLEVDKGSSYIGEVALLSFDSPINNTGILFLNTLFDENASCHLALGRAYPMNVQGGTSMTQEELTKIGSNLSMVHSDFMFGSRDMNIVGTLKDGSKITIFKDGNYVI
jgi:aminopeptidase